MASKSILTCFLRPSCTTLLGSNGTVASLLPTSYVSVQQVRHRRYPKFVVRQNKRKTWHVRKWTQKYDDNLLTSNEQFIKDVIVENYAKNSDSPLKDAPWDRNPYVYGTRRTGVLALKLGTMLQWTTEGKPFMVTLLQVLDNHVINYVPPEVYATYPSHLPHHRQKFGLQIVGALSSDPRMFSKPYNNLFIKAGVPPKRWLTRFLITPNAACQPGTPLSVNHFKVGEYVDIQGRTRDWGFQGVCKRWGMKGMPASHGVTKSHRKMGSTGGGGDKDGIWKGKHMPGIMGDILRTQYGLKIWRINTKYNVLYVTGAAVCGRPHTFVRVYDTVLPRKKRPESSYESVPMPTWFEEDATEPLPEEYFDSKLFQFTSPSLEIEEEKK
ncbi:39S ribosomal protein L3, mitochondrial-like [Biomphalaria glabrata]|uniref:Large ribosomal subunit protein uL3m n=2 Tax=Biomphalaria glabrata TaxID=6526 RepID=A0A9W3AXK0_BIOGL|nr:39S ribosomal protein L3, mitochondrial-like [Biomphalaria glabrata]KAI8746504.1 39S ribosomal protein L3, mitochondrial [Biomphalaria glabrata]